jgi:hypothetical protein
MSRPGNIVVALVVVALLSVPASGQDPNARARAALALSKARTAAVAAPMPREVSPPIPYAAAKARSVATGTPAVVYVGCEKRHDRVPGSVTTCVPEMEGYESLTVLVCYPQGGILYVSETLRCPVSPERLREAVEKARLKVAPKTNQASGPKLDWS